MLVSYLAMRHAERVECVLCVLIWLLFKQNIIPPETSLLHDNVAFVLCLDTLANGDELYMHVSRPPKPDTPMHSFIQQLEEVTGFTVTTCV